MTTRPVVSEVTVYDCGVCFKINYGVCGPLVAVTMKGGASRGLPDAASMEKLESHASNLRQGDEHARKNMLKLGNVAEHILDATSIEQSNDIEARWPMSKG